MSLEKALFEQSDSGGLTDDIEIEISASEKMTQDQPTNSESKKRQSHIDGMRALAILFMVWVHIAAAFQPVTPPSIAGLTISSIFGGLAAPLFITISGWGLHRSASRRIAASNTPTRDIIRWLTPRISLLLICQILINLLMSHVFDIFTPGVLTLLALAAILAPCTAALSSKSRGLIALTFALSPLLLGDLTGLTWGWSERMAGVGFSGTIERLLWNGAYPAFPWLAFSLLGSLIQDTTRKERIVAISTLIPVASLATILLWPNGGDLVATIGNASLTFFPASTPFMLVAMSAVLTIHLVLESTEDYRFWLSSLGRASVALGNISLTIYILHFIPLALLHHSLGTMVISNDVLALIIISYTLIWLPVATLHSRHIPDVSFEGLLRRSE